MKIYVIRHGETTANKEGVLQGSSNWPLNEYGVKLAELTGEKMKDIKFDVCFSSTLDRAKQTAKIVLEKSGNDNTPTIYDERIKEINLGIYEGKKIIPDQLEVPLFTILTFKYNPFLSRRFKGGETTREVCKRTQEFLKEVINSNYENVLISTHGFALRAMLNMLEKNKFNFWQGGVPYNCSVCIIEVKDGKATLLEKDKIYYDKKYLVDHFDFKKKK